MEVEAREYGPDCTEAERALLLAQVEVYKDGVILFKEVPCPSEFQIHLCCGKIIELAKNYNPCFLIIDLTRANPPGAKLRRRLSDEFRQINPFVEHVCIFTGKNVLLNTAAKFVLKTVGMNSFTVNRTKKKCLEEINKRLSAREIS